MQKQYEAPELTVIGDANHIVMGSTGAGLDFGHQGAPDFEFEHDWPLI
jgi:hypothetical protein